MKSAQLSPWHLRWFYVIAGLVFFSGAICLGIDALAAIKRGWIRWPNPVAFKIMEFHTLIAFAFCGAVGSLFPVHIANAWQSQRNRTTGLILLGLVLGLTVTGWRLQIMTDDLTYYWLRRSHWLMGLVPVLLFPLHLVMGRRSRKR